LYDPKADGPNLKFLVDATGNGFGPQVHAKEKVFAQTAAGYVTSGYAGVRDDEDKMDGEMSTEQYVVNFMDGGSSSFGGF